MSITKIIIALLIFSVIVIFHELGHFLLAKKNGIKVTEFSLGMGPRLLSHQGKETRYSLKLLPLGGSCMMLGEDETCEDERAFNKQGVWARISVIAAGPIFNFILAFVLALFVIGFSGIDEAYVRDVAKNYPAAEAGIQAGDKITKINGKKIDISRDIDVYFQFNPLAENKEVSVTYERDGKEQEVKLLPKKYDRYMLGITRSTDEGPAKFTTVTENGPAGKAGLKANDVIKSIDGTELKSGIAFGEYIVEHPFTNKEVTIVYERDGKEATVKVTPELASSAYSLGLSYNQARSGKVTNPVNIVKYSYTEVRFWIKTVFASLGELVSGKLSKDDIGGPVYMFQMIGDSYEQAAAIDVETVLLQLGYLIILLSANLGVMNLLPLPALDGGRLVFLFIEAVRGKPIDPEKEGFVHMIGFIALMLLMVFVFYNDIMRIIH